MKQNPNHSLIAILPSIFATPFQKDGDGLARELLSPAEQETLLRISELVEISRNTVLYSEGDTACFVYNVVAGVAETYRHELAGDKHVTAFLFPHDLMGLSANGFYVSTAKSLTTLLVFRIPVGALKAILECNPRLDVGLLCKLCHELRSAQYHAITISKREASVRLARFLLWIEAENAERDGEYRSIELPMSRHEIADYIGLSVEAVSRALHFLEAEGAILRDGPRSIAVLDRERLQALAD